MYVKMPKTAEKQGAEITVLQVHICALSFSKCAKIS